MADSFNYAAASRNLRERERERKQRCLELHSKASKDALAIVEMIKEKFHPKRIYQWGSLLHPEKFDENSDIDIAVEGISNTEDFFALFGSATEMTGFSLDLVEFEKIHHLHQDSIRKRGRIVYEQQD